jgi:hypothetical protein
VVAPALLLAVGAMTVGCWWLTTTDFPLETAQ